ncbi:hypothetical protein C8Q76DRAFT_607829, partial [Earliella scabrosa]
MLGNISSSDTSLSDYGSDDRWHYDINYVGDHFSGGTEDLDSDDNLDEGWSTPDHEQSHDPRPPTPGSDYHDISDDDGFEIDESDPVYATIEALYAQNHQEPQHAARRLPRALQEHPYIRRAYVDAFVHSTVHGATQDAVQHLLESSRERLRALVRDCGVDIPGLDRMAITLRTVERRLGLDPDSVIVYFFVCDRCWFLHWPDELAGLRDEWCTQEDCGGRVFKYKTYSDGSRRRLPVKVLPTTSPQEWIRRLVRRPGKLQELNAWRRGANDEPGPVPPVPPAEWVGHGDPSFRMYDIMDGWGWHAIQAGLSRRQGGRWEVQDVDVHEMNQKFVALPNGLVLQFNLDWYRGNYSVGAIYLTVDNNPRSKRFLREETFLLTIIPGPDEPSLEQLNYILELFIPDFQELYQGSRKLHLCIGVQMALDEDDPQPVHGYVYIESSDLPASRKSTGMLSYTSKWFMCTICKQPLHSLTDPDCFDPSKLKLREEGRYLKYAFRARSADPATRKELADERGVRWSALDDLPDWWPASDAPPDFMHAAYLGETKHVVQGILSGGGMFVRRSRMDNPLQKLETWMETIWWPSTAGRVPKNLITTGAGKADQWRNMTAVLIPALYESWQINGKIPDQDAPRLNAKQKAGIKAQRVAALVNERRAEAASHKRTTTVEDLQSIDQSSMRRNYKEHFETVLEWLTAIRIWGSSSISVDEAYRAQECHNRACQAWARMLCHLTPYFHLLVHLILWILRLGPVYGWWVYAYERCNGFLSKVRHNGHQGGELEATMMRAWTKLHLLYDLVRLLGALGDQKSPEDELSIRDLKECLHGNKKASNGRGTLLTAIAAMTAHESGDLIKYPKQSHAKNLWKEGIYMIVFRYLRNAWKNDVTLELDTSDDERGSPFIALSTPFYSHILVAGQRYGASTMHRGLGTRYAYINGRQAVDILHIIKVDYITNEGKNLHADLAIIRPFVPSPAASAMPWADRAVDLGLDVWEPDTLGSPRVIDVREFSGHFALNYVTHPER